MMSFDTALDKSKWSPILYIITAISAIIMITSTVVINDNVML